MEHYRLIERRGEGTFAEVWEAESRLTGERVAIKVLKKQQAQSPLLESDMEYKILRLFVRNTGYVMDDDLTTTTGDDAAYSSASPKSVTTASSPKQNSSDSLTFSKTGEPGRYPHQTNPHAVNPHTAEGKPTSFHYSSHHDNGPRLHCGLDPRTHPGLARIKFHPQILGLYDAFWQRGNVVFVLELLGHSLLDEIVVRKRRMSPRRPLFSIDELRVLLYQILLAVDAMHSSGVFHRDIKPENILMQLRSDPLRIKLADFGSSQLIRRCDISKTREGNHNAGAGKYIAGKNTPASSGAGSGQPYSSHRYTEYIATRWYRSPECLLTSGSYGTPMDLWAVGCVGAELISGIPLFPGKNERDQMYLINSVYQSSTSRKQLEDRMGPLGGHVKLDEKSRGGCPLPPQLLSKHQSSNKDEAAAGDSTSTTTSISGGITSQCASTIGGLIGRLAHPSSHHHELSHSKSPRADPGYTDKHGPDHTEGSSAEGFSSLSGISSSIAGLPRASNKTYSTKSLLPPFLRSPAPSLSNWLVHNSSSRRTGLSHPSLDRWHKIIAPRISPYLSHDLSDLLYRLLAYYPQERITAAEALQHKFFEELR